jgi:serine/threonine protein kinase/Tfp pilus assembly protein PilF
MSDTPNPVTLDTSPPETRRGLLESAWRAWRAGHALPRWEQFLPESDEPCPAEQIFRLVRTDIEFRIRNGLPGLLSERYFENSRLRQTDVGRDAQRIVELIRWEYSLRWQNGVPARREDYKAAFPEHAAALSDLMPRSRCPNCQGWIVHEETVQTLRCPECGSEASPTPMPPPFVPDLPRATLTTLALDLRDYELSEQLGRGGMGEVYRARDPALGRDLAVKVMKQAFRGNIQAEQRFLREARITGSLQHPGIVPVHNLGRLEDGRLHYTMKLVRGETFADLLRGRAGQAQHWPKLLEIFAGVCQAVAYAHSKRVLHRDLKPANVMVGKFGEVQVMDWGLAKLMAPADHAAEPEEAEDAPGTWICIEPADTPLDLSRAGRGMGTPDYMPPEQAQGEWERVDERADVFALGAILCYVLTGRPPYPGPNANEIYRRAQQGDVSDAWERLDRCGADASLVRLCRECLAPERDNRPRDAGVVAGRLSQYQAEVQGRLRQAELERVAAETRAQEEHRRAAIEQERAREAVARAAAERRATRRLLTFAVALLVIFAAAFVLVRRSEQEAKSARDDLELIATANKQLADEKGALADKEKRARVTAETALDDLRTGLTMLGGMFEASDPLGLQSISMVLPRRTGERLSAQDLLDRGARKCEQELKDRPELQGTILVSIGNTYVNLGEYEKAQPLLEKALRLLKESGGHPRELAACLHSLGSLSHARGDYQTAVQRYGLALKLREELQPPDELSVADTVFNLGWLQTEQEEFAEAEKHFQRCLSLRKKQLGEQHRLVALAQMGLSALYLEQETNLLEALVLMQQAVRTFERQEGNQSLTRAIGLYQQGIMLLHGGNELPLVGRNARLQGENNLLECLRLVKESPLGPRHIIVAFVLATLAMELHNSPDVARIESYYRECLSIVEERVGLAHPKLDSLLPGFVDLLKRQQKEEEAIQLYERVLMERQKQFGQSHLHVANVLVAYARLLDPFDPRRDPMLARACTIYQQARPLKGRTSLRMYENCLAQRAVIARDIDQDPVAAEQLLRTDWEMLQQASAIHPVNRANHRLILAAALQMQGKDSEAETILDEVRKACEQLGRQADSVLRPAFDYSVYLSFRKADPAKVAAFSLERSKLWPNDADQLYFAGRDLLRCVPLVGRDKRTLTEDEREQKLAYQQQGTALCRKAVGLYRKGLGAKNPSFKYCLTCLSHGYVYIQDYEQAETVRAEALSLYRQDLGAEHDEVAGALILLAEVQLARRKYGDAEKALRAAVDIRRLHWAGHTALASVLAQLGLCLLHAGKPAEAEPVLRECLEIRSKHQPEDWLVFDTKSTLGGSLLMQKKYAEAERLLVEGYEGMRQRRTQIPPEGETRLIESVERLVQLHEATGRNDKAESWRKLLDEMKKKQSGSGQ